MSHMAAESQLSRLYIDYLTVAIGCVTIMHFYFFLQLTI